MGKYSSVAAALRPMPEVSEFQTQIDGVKKQIAHTTPSDLSKDLLAIRIEKDAAKKALSAINVRLVAHEQLLADAFEASGITNIRLESGVSISTQIKPYARVHDRARFHAWCVANGLSEALQLPWQSTNALVSDRLVEGLPEPDGIETHKKTVVVVRKGNG